MRERMLQELEKLKAELARGTGQLQQVEQQRAHLTETIIRLQGAMVLAEQALAWDNELDQLHPATNGENLETRI